MAPLHHPPPGVGIFSVKSQTANILGFTVCMVSTSNTNTAFSVQKESQTIPKRMSITVFQFKKSERKEERKKCVHYLSK